MRFVNYHQGCCGFVPTHADGSEWAHILVLADGGVVHADTAREVLEELIPGYASASSAEVRRAARTRHASEAAGRAQASRIEDAIVRGRLDPSDPDDLAVIAILSAPKDLGMVLAIPGTPDVQAPWEGPVELVLVTTSYAPHTDVPRARGRVAWLDPTQEETYLVSLHALRVHDYWAAAPAAGSGIRTPAS